MGTKSFFDSDITLQGVLPSIWRGMALHKYELFDCFRHWHNNPTFPIYSRWKKIVTGAHGTVSVNLILI